MKDRKFGVELEFHARGIGAGGVVNIMTASGFDYEWIGDSYCECYSEYEYDDCGCGYDNVGYDGSEIEVRTPILQGSEGFKNLKRLVELFNANGFTTGEYDGLHVHHDAPEFIDNKPLILKLLKSWKYNEAHISKFIDEGRRDWALNEPGDSPCPTFSYDAITAYENMSDGYLPGYPNNFSRNNLNINSLREHGTIEFRFHEGTLNWPEIESWILFGQSFLDGVISRKNPIMPADNPVVLLNRLKTNNRAKRVLIRKAGVAA